MTPDQIAAMSVLAGLLEYLSQWPFALFFFIVVVGPWLLAILLAYADRKRFEGVVRMYEDNVALVEDYRSLAGDLKEVVIMNTQAIVGLDNDISKNQFCPLVRKEQA